MDLLTDLVKQNPYPKTIDLIIGSPHTAFLCLPTPTVCSRTDATIATGGTPQSIVGLVRARQQFEEQWPPLALTAVQDFSNTQLQRSVHINCPKCHHFHKNTPLTLPTDSDRHTRFKYIKCQHQIFGIGRTSTQTTLASVDSIPLSRVISGLALAVRSCSDQRSPRPSRDINLLPNPSTQVQSAFNLTPTSGLQSPLLVEPVPDVTELSQKPTSTDDIASKEEDPEQHQQPSRQPRRSPLAQAMAIRLPAHPPSQD